mgnify:CR=1 FL=1
MYQNRLHHLGQLKDKLLFLYHLRRVRGICGQNIVQLDLHLAQKPLEDRNNHRALMMPQRTRRRLQGLLIDP